MSAEGQPQQQVVEPFIVKVQDAYATINKDAFTVGAIRTLGPQGWEAPLTWSGAVGAPVDQAGNGLAAVEFMATVEMNWGFKPSEYTKDYEIQASIDLVKNKTLFELLKNMEKIKLDLINERLLGPDNKGPLSAKSIGFPAQFLTPDAFRIGRWSGENKPWSEKEIEEKEDDAPQEGKGQWKKGGFKKGGAVKMDERSDDKKEGEKKRITWYLSGRKDNVACVITRYSPTGVPENEVVADYLTQPQFLQKGVFVITFAVLGISLVDQAMGKSKKSQTAGLKYALTGVYLDMKNRPLAPPKAVPMSAMQRLALTESKGTFRIDTSRARGAGAPGPSATPAPLAAPGGGRAENGEPSSKKRKAEGAPE